MRIKQTLTELINSCMGSGSKGDCPTHWMENSDKKSKPDHDSAIYNYMP